MWIDMGILMFLLQRKKKTVNKSSVWGRNEMTATITLFNR